MKTCHVCGMKFEYDEGEDREIYEYDTWTDEILSSEWVWACYGCIELATEEAEAFRKGVSVQELRYG